MNVGNSSQVESSPEAIRSSLSNSQPKTPTARQSSLDFEAAGPRNLNDDVLVRRAISISIRRCSKSREQIAEEMSELLGVRVTEKMLDNYSASAMQPNRFPAAWDRAFCAAVGDDTLLKCRAEAAGYLLIRNEEKELLELGREYLRQKRANERVAMLEKRLQGVDL